MSGSVLFRAIKLSALIRWWPWPVVILAAVVAWGYYWSPASWALPSSSGGPPQALPVAVPTEPRPVHRSQPIYTMPVQDRLISFAVNIDWGGEFLPGMLEVLAARDTKVTFFPTGRWAALEPDLTRQLVLAGHELGNHGYRHDHPKSLNDAALRDHIVSNQQLLQDLTGVTTRLYAPPYGEVDARIARVSSETDHWTIMWTIDTVDWQRPSSDVIVRRVVPKVQPGAIVLMHPTESTAAALPTMLDMLLDDGWTVVPVGTMLDHVLTVQTGAPGDKDVAR